MNLSYQGNCTEDSVIEEIFGDVSNFANMVEQHGDCFTVGKLVVKYDAESDIHNFYFEIAEHMIEEYADGTLVDACSGCYATTGNYRYPNVK